MIRPSVRRRVRAAVRACRPERLGRQRLLQQLYVAALEAECRDDTGVTVDLLAEWAEQAVKLPTPTACPECAGPRTVEFDMADDTEPFEWCDACCVAS